MRSRVTDSNGAPHRWWQGEIGSWELSGPIYDGRADPSAPLWERGPQSDDGFTVTFGVVVDNWAWRDLGEGPELVGEVRLA